MNKKVVKRFLAMALTASMMIPSVPVRVEAADTEVEVPEPYYEFTFDEEGDSNTQVTNVGSKEGAIAKFEGNGSELGITYDTNRTSNVLNLPGGSVGAGRLILPDGMFDEVTETSGFAFSFWINIDGNAGQYNRIFSGTINGQNYSNGSGGWNEPEFSFVAGKETATDLGDGQSGYHTAILLPDKTTSLKLVWEKQFSRDTWQHVMLSVSKDSYDIYMNGQPVGITYDRNNNLSTFLTSLFANDAANLKQYKKCAIGSSVYTTDADIKAKMDEFRFYNTALTKEQAEAVYDSYKIDPKLITALKEKITEAEGKSISFYTRETYTALQSAIKAGKQGVEDAKTYATTAENIKSLTSDLENAIADLKPYEEGVTEGTFSNAQLTAENTAAKEILSKGGFTSDARDSLQIATTKADEALKLTGAEENDQKTVDEALEGLRAVINGLNETSLATPVIETQPIKKAYDLGKTAKPLSVGAKIDVVGDTGSSLSYQWYQNTTKSTEGGTAIDGATEATYIPSTATAGKMYYYCVVTNANYSAIPSASKTVTSNVVQIRVNAAGEVNVPKPYYEFTFDVTADDGKEEVTNVGSKTGATAKIEGSKEGLGVDKDSERASKVLNLPGGSTNGAVEGRLSLPKNMFADVTNDGFAFSFWINIDEAAGQYSRIFSGTVNGQNSDVGNNAWNAPEFSFVAGSETAGDMAEGKAGYNTAILLPDGADDDKDGKADHSTTQLKLVWEEQFAKGKWQHVTISVSPTKYDVYLDGELVGIKYDRNNNMSAVLGSLFANNAAILKQYEDCSIGASVYKTDKDLKAKVDEFRFYNTYLTMEQAEAAYDSYAVDEELVDNLEAKVQEAKDKNKGISFYTRKNYEALVSAIAAGEQGVANPVTNENVQNLINKLDAAIAGLKTYYNDSITDDTTFTNVQLQDEVKDARAAIEEGCLDPDSETAIQEAVTSAEEALKLTEDDENAQEKVDAALTALRAAVDAKAYEDAAATPVIDDDGQPQAATYTKDDTSVVVAPLTVTATVSDKGNLTYQWYQNTTNSTTEGSKIEGANTASYTPVVGDVGITYYYCVVTNTQNKAVTTKTATTTSAVAAVTVKEVETPDITGQPASTTYQLGSETKPSLRVVVAAVSEGTLTYQWYQNTSNSTDGGTAITNATEASYTPNITEAGTTYYYCVVTNTIGTAMKRATSNVVSVKAAEDLSQVAADPSITTQPQGAEYTTSDTAQPLTIKATVDDGGTLSYQWYKNTTDSTEGGAAIEGKTSASYTPDISTEGITYYYCVVTNTKGEGEAAVTATAISNVVKIEVAQGSVTPKPEAVEPEITTQPKGATYTYGKTAKALSVVASVSDEGTLSYQWYKKTAEDAEGETIEGATEDAYTPAVTAVGTIYYYCVVTNTKESKTAETTSDVVAIKVNKATSTITGVSAVTTTFGKSVTLKAKGKGAITYASSNTKVLTIGKTNGKIKTVGYGKTEVTIKAAGDKNYKGATKKITVTVKPKKMTVSSAKSTKKKTLTVKWKKDAKADGYKVQYSTDKKFKKSVKTATVKKGKTVKTTLKKLNAGKKYYVRICAYKGSGKNQVCGDWSKAKNAKVK